jgi:uncharacterized protein
LCERGTLATPLATNISSKEFTVANRLQYETSPYLLQHKDNPVDWYPWGEEAFQRAKDEDKPVLLSVGYSACHWCHVMEHESFSSERIANLMNRHFVNIKVDREERPDVDSIYMTAVQMMTGQGGWPMTVFLTPDGEPFYGGTYFPPNDRPPLPAFPKVLQTIAQAFQERRDELVDSASKVGQALNEHFQHELETTTLSEATLDEAARNLAPQFDAYNGGFGGAPKFPPSMLIDFLLRTYHRTGADRSLQMAETTLQKMAYGGIHDQIGGGFHRYTVDAIWLTPHFEKMLYDNGLLARAYVDAWRLTGNPLYQETAEGVFQYVLREMTSLEGGFYSAQDADSEGEEGKFYVWTEDEIDAVLESAEADVVKRFYGTSVTGNFEGKNIFSVPRDPADVAADLDMNKDDLLEIVRHANRKLYEVRAQRVWPSRDDKILTSWNGLMLRAFAEGAVAFDRADLLDAAVANATFIRQNLWQDGRLLRTYKDGQAKVDGFLEDYTYLANGLISLYEATCDPAWLRWADELASAMISEFADEQNAGFFDTNSRHSGLITRPKEFVDNAQPSGNSMAAELLQRLAILTGKTDYRRRAVEILERYGTLAAQQPNGFGHMLAAFDFAMSTPIEVAIVGHPDDAATRELLATVHQAYLPSKVVVLADPESIDDLSELIPLLAHRQMIDEKPTAYVCQNYACKQPVTDSASLREQLGLSQVR